MKTLTMYGSSDDLIEADGIEGADEYGIFASDTWPYVATFAVTSQSESKGLNVHVLYDGSWSFAVSADDTEKLCEWPIRRSWGTDCDYSETLEIDVPDDAIIKRVERK